MSDADKIIEGLKGELESLRPEVATLKKEAVVHRRTEEELRRTTQEAEGIGNGLRLLGGTARVLVMDDEEVIRSMAKRMLKLQGCQVELAGDGDEALELYRSAMRSGKIFRAVLINLTITEGLGGRETIKKLLPMDPAAQVAVSSGCSNDPIMAEYQSYGFSGVISKPYDIQTLSQVMDQIIAQKAQ